MIANRSPAIGGPRRPETALRLALAFAGILTLEGCANLANVRTLGSGIRTVGDDTTTIIAADRASCLQSNAQIVEYDTIFAKAVPQIDCVAADKTLARLLSENRALQAYGEALASLAQDQYVTTTDDGQTVSGIAQTAGASPAVVSAMSTVFASIESWSLSGYRQHQIRQAIDGPAAEAFLKIAADLQVLRATYRTHLENEQLRLKLMQAAVSDAANREPIASAEMNLRLQSLSLAVSDKLAALDAYDSAAQTLPGALAAAQTALDHPDKSAIEASIKTFASQAKDAHDKIAAAFPHAI